MISTMLVGTLMFRPAYHVSAYRPLGGLVMRTKKMATKKIKMNNKKMYLDAFELSSEPKTDNQMVYYQSLNNEAHDIVMVSGPAGTGKTHFACEHAIEKLAANDINRIVITRPIVSVDNEEMGFLPGTINSKMAPWTRPIFDLFSDYYDTRQIERMVADNVIEISPIAYMRGRTFKRCFVIADEMQNSTPTQMKMLLTRLGEGSRMVITGDPEQTDLKDQQNGFSDFLGKYRSFSKRKNPVTNIDLVSLTQQDIVRSEVVKSVIDIYDFDDRKEPKFSSDKVKSAIDQLMKHNSSSVTNRIVNVSNDCAMIPKSEISKGENLNRRANASRQGGYERNDDENVTL